MKLSLPSTDPPAVCRLQFGQFYLILPLPNRDPPAVRLTLTALPSFAVSDLPHNNDKKKKRPQRIS